MKRSQIPRTTLAIVSKVAKIVKFFMTTSRVFPFQSMPIKNDDMQTVSDSIERYCAGRQLTISFMMHGLE